MVRCVAYFGRCLLTMLLGGSHGNQGGQESGGFEEDPQSGSSRLVTEGTGEEGVYKYAFAVFHALRADVVR